MSSENLDNNSRTKQQQQQQRQSRSEERNVAAEAAVLGEEQEDEETEFSFSQSAKTLALVSLPHLAILLLFMVYLFVGAAIMKEIEADSAAAAAAASHAAHKANVQIINNQLNSLDLDAISVDFDFKALNELLAKYQSSLTKINHDTKSKLKHHLNKLNKNNRDLLNGLSLDLARTLNLTINTNRKSIAHEKNYDDDDDDGNHQDDDYDDENESTEDEDDEEVVRRKKRRKSKFKQLNVDILAATDYDDLDLLSDRDETIRFLSTKLKLQTTATTTATATTEKDKKAKSKKNSAAATDLVDPKELLKSIAEHLIAYKGELKLKVIESFHNLMNQHENEKYKIENDIHHLIKHYEHQIKSETINYHRNIEKAIDDTQFKIKLDDDALLGSTKTPAAATTAAAAAGSSTSTPVAGKKNWTFSNSLYFVGGLLTQIGFGDLAPKTIFGKLFVMIYLFIGIPLTLILLADFASILTKYVKFLHLFFTILKQDGYFKRITRLLSLAFVFSKSAAIKTTKSSSSSGTRSPNRSVSDPNDLDDEDDEDKKSNEILIEKPSNLIRSLIEIAFNCLEQTDDTFDLSLSSLFGLVFIYLTFGAIVSSNLSNWSLFDGYYFSLITLTKIGLGDLAIEQPRYLLASCFYTLFGLAFFTLTMQTLQEKLRILIISNGQRLVIEFVKFTNQLGYNFNADNMNRNLVNICKMPPLVVYDDLMIDDAETMSSSFARLSSSAALESSKFLLHPINLGITASTSTPNIPSSDDDITGKGSGGDQDPFYSANSRSYLRKKLPKRSHTFKDGLLHDHHHHHHHAVVNKCDKQTQITTLLFSKFKYDKEEASLLMSSFAGNLDKIGLMPISASQSESAAKSTEKSKPSMLNEQPSSSSSQSTLIDNNNNNNSNSNDNNLSSGKIKIVHQQVDEENQQQLNEENDSKKKKPDAVVSIESPVVIETVIFKTTTKTTTSATPAAPAATATSTAAESRPVRRNRFGGSDSPATSSTSTFSSNRTACAATASANLLKK